MAQRRRVENPVVDVSISDDESFSFVFHKAAAELTKLYSLAVDGHVAFDAGARHAYMGVYEWIQLQLQNGILLTAADICSYLQDKINQLDNDVLNDQQLVEVEESANEMVPENDMNNAHQLPEPSANETESGASDDINTNPSASQVQEMEIN
ncbi:hypothetical protein ACET3Z_001632 [Daucus carota]